MRIFKYGPAEVNYLKSQDKLLGLAIDRIGIIERETNPDLFTALINSIVSQQISKNAAATVWSRLCDCLGEITPETIASTPVEMIQKCGLSMRKAGYIKNISEQETKGELNLSEFRNLSDVEIVKRLTALNGVGIWTVEMLMIFSLERPDVVSWGDLAIRRGMMNLYGLETLSKSEFDAYRKRYSPYGSVASLYLWELSHE